MPLLVGSPVPAAPPAGQTPSNSAVAAPGSRRRSSLSLTGATPISATSTSASSASSSSPPSPSLAQHDHHHSLSLAAALQTIAIGTPQKDSSLTRRHHQHASHRKFLPSLPPHSDDACNYAVMAATADDARLDASPERDDDDSRSSSSDSPAPIDNEESDFFLGNNDSQSSLGAVNLQDMQVMDDACWPPINRLPNEILISIFSRLTAPADHYRITLVCRRWARNAVELLWHRPACTSWNSHRNICQTLAADKPFFSYRDFVKRLNLAALGKEVNDGSVLPLAVCTRIERLTLTNCAGLTDTGLTALLQKNRNLLALDVSNDRNITETSIYTMAENCQRLQGLNISGCTAISNQSLIALAKSCRYIKRLKFNDCVQIRDPAIHAFAENCPNILEIDLQQCSLITNPPVTSLLANGNCLRELRLSSCELIDDAAFLSLPKGKKFEHLRILDLTSCARLTDTAVCAIIEASPRLRNLVLAKCRNITDVAVNAISKLGKNLHYVHLGHCNQITDEGVKKLIASCTRIRYIDLGCCTNLTDDSVKRLALLPKLKRIGLVKCNSITDESIFTLAEVARKPRLRRDSNGLLYSGEYYSSNLERVHLSYCINLTLKSIVKLLNSCPRLTHLSLTGVHAFQRDEFTPFCREAPPEFTQHQRDVFCVFSGNMVSRFRDFLNTSPLFEELREPFLSVRGGRPRGSIGSRRFSADANPIPPFDDMYEFEGNGDEANDEAEPFGPISTQHPVYPHAIATDDVLDMAADQVMQNFGAGTGAAPVFSQISYADVTGGAPGAPASHAPPHAPPALGIPSFSTFIMNEPASGPPPLSAFGQSQASMAGIVYESTPAGASTASMHLQPGQDANMGPSSTDDASSDEM